MDQAASEPQKQQQVVKQTQKKQPLKPTIQHPHHPSSKNPQQSKQESKQQNKQQQQDIIIQQKIVQYFSRAIDKNSNSAKRQSESHQAMAEESICEAIKIGMVEVQENQVSLDSLLQSKVQEIPDEQKIRKKMIQARLQYLNSQINRSRSKSRQNQQIQQEAIDSHMVLSKNQHKEFLQRMYKNRIENSKRREKMSHVNLKKMEQQQQLRKMAEKQKHDRQLEERQKKILQREKKHQEQKQQKLKQSQEYNRRLEQIKKKKCLHDILQEKYNSQVVLPTLEEKKKKLKQIRDMNRAFNVTDINVHQKQYVRKRQESLSTSQAKRSKQAWEYKKPHKSERLAKILQEEARQVKLKLEQKKRKLQQKIWRQEQFANYLKQKRAPKIDPKKRQQIQKRLHSEQQRERLKHQRPDGKTLGQNYLQQVKKMRKKSANSQLQFKNRILVSQDSAIEQQQGSNKKASTNYLPHRKTKKQYDQIRQKRIQKLINSQTSDKLSKISQLQLQADKLIQEQRRLQEKSKLRKGKTHRDQQESQGIGLLLASIKAKMGIIDVYNKD